MINRIMLAIQFLTIIPAPAIMISKEDYHRVMGWFPVAGLLVGTISAMVYWVSIQVLPLKISVILVLMTQFFITGGLHHDGLADTFDGCMSGRDLQRKLDIMKDSRLGTHGAVILFFILLLKFTTLLLTPDTTRTLIIILTPVIGRFALVFGAWKSSYARDEGLGNLFIGVINTKDIVTALVLSLICMLIYPSAYISLVIVIPGIILTKKVMSKTLNGMTGDTLGALNEISETLFMLVMIMLVNWR